jgi:hypothetical protein
VLLEESEGTPPEGQAPSAEFRQTAMKLPPVPLMADVVPFALAVWEIRTACPASLTEANINSMKKSRLI